MEATLKMIQVALMQTQAKIYELKERELGLKNQEKAVREAMEHQLKEIQKAKKGGLAPHQTPKSEVG